MKLDEKLVHLREEKGLTQLELAEAMQVSRQAVSRWEVGAAVPSIENLKYLGSLYNVPLDYLLDDSVLEPMRVISGVENEGKESQQKKRNNRGLVLILIAIGILVAVFCSIFF